MEEAHLSAQLLKKSEPTSITHRIKNVSGEQSIDERHDDCRPFDVKAENARKSSPRDLTISDRGRLPDGSLFSDASVQLFVSVGFSNSSLDHNLPWGQLREKEISFSAAV